MSVYRRLILDFVDDESDVHHVCVMVVFNKLNLYLVGNGLVYFYEHLL